jgi:lysophospholipase L1-like esterase
VKRRGIGSLIVNLTLAVASTVFFAGALEAGARALGLTSGFFLIPTPENCLQRDHLLSLSFRANCSGSLGGTDFQTNSLGYRGAEPRAGRRRILSVGDSCTWGWLVGQQQSYPAVLQRLLDDGDTNEHYDVINAGVPGHTSYQGLLHLRDRALALDPSVVIINYGFNDPFRTGDVERQLRWEQWLIPLLELDDLLLRKSHLWSWARWKGEMKGQEERGPRVTAEGYRANIASMVEAARRHGARVLILSLWGEYETGPYRQALFGVAEEKGVPILQYEGPRLDVVHPTAEGYETFTSKILLRLVYEGYLR